MTTDNASQARAPQAADQTDLKSRCEDQSQRIAALARGREEDLATIGKLRAELALVARERDALRRKLTALEGMQTETIALSEEQFRQQSAEFSAAVPSIEDLMSSFGGKSAATLQSHSTLATDKVAGDDDYQEMLSPDEMVLGSKSNLSRHAMRHCLVLLQSGEQVRFPVDQDLITIGRSESADIQAEGDFISRIHARVLRIGMDVIIEDAGSKNGTRVNSESIDRHVLKNGDLVQVGSACFRYIDAAAASVSDD